MADNFQNTVESLFKGMENFITTKTVVGDAITVGDTIILPLVDVSFGVAASAKSEAGQRQEPGQHDKDPRYGSGFREQIHAGKRRKEREQPGGRRSDSCGGYLGRRELLMNTPQTDRTNSQICLRDIFILNILLPNA